LIFDYYIIATLIYLFCMGIVYLIWKCRDLNRREYFLLFFVGMVMVWLSPVLMDRLGPTTLFVVYTLVPLAAAVVSTQMGQRTQVESEVSADMAQVEAEVYILEALPIETLSVEAIPEGIELRPERALRRWYLQNGGQLRYNRKLPIPPSNESESSFSEDPLAVELVNEHQEYHLSYEITADESADTEVDTSAENVIITQVEAASESLTDSMDATATGTSEADSPDIIEDAAAAWDVIDVVATESMAEASVSFDEEPTPVDEPVEMVEVMITEQIIEPLAVADSEDVVGTEDIVEAEEADDSDGQPLELHNMVDAADEAVIIAKHTLVSEHSDELELPPVATQNEPVAEVDLLDQIEEQDPSEEEKPPSDIINESGLENSPITEAVGEMPMDNREEIPADQETEELTISEKIDDTEDSVPQKLEPVIATAKEAEFTQEETAEAADTEEEMVAAPDVVAVGDESTPDLDLITEKFESELLPDLEPVTNIPVAAVIQQMDDTGDEIRHNIAEGTLSLAGEIENSPALEAGIVPVIGEQRQVKSARQRMMEEKVNRLLDAGFNAKFAADWPTAVKNFEEALKITNDSSLKGMLVRDIAGMYLEMADYQRAQQTYQDYINDDLDLEERKDITRGLLRARYMEQELTNRKMPLMPYRKVPRLLQIKVEDMLNRIDISKQVEGSKKRK